MLAIHPQQPPQRCRIDPSQQSLQDAARLHAPLRGSYYVGSTWDLDRRLEQHSTGLGSVYTRSRLPVELVFAAELERIDEAYALEKRIQGWSRRKREALIEGRYADLPVLSKKDFGRSAD